MRYKEALTYLKENFGYSPRVAAVKLSADSDFRESQQENIGQINIEKIIKYNLPGR